MDMCNKLLQHLTNKEAGINDAFMHLVVHLYFEKCIGKPSQILRFHCLLLLFITNRSTFSVLYSFSSVMYVTRALFTHLSSRIFSFYFHVFITDFLASVVIDLSNSLFSYLIRCIAGAFIVPAIFASVSIFLCDIT